MVNMILRLYLATVVTALAAMGLTPTPLDLPPLPSDYPVHMLPKGTPLKPPSYMVNNQGNTHHAAPDKGSMDGPVVNATDMAAVKKHEGHSNATAASRLKARSACSSWICGIEHGGMPLAPDGYQFYRNVQDFGAVGDGVTDDTEAINLAASAFSLTNLTNGRCGADCGSTTVLGALVYFPPGMYLISTPIIQYYYTQFIGDLVDQPTLVGSSNFTGIAMIDTDVYIPGGNGAEWYINQNQFFRQIRNFKFDMTNMPFSNTDNGQEYVPTGIHWQVAQATSLQNLYFEMPVSGTETTTAVGIFMENGSGGFLSDITFFGGNIGFRAGSQQYTARNLHFTSCLTAISMIWDWGFTWQDITVFSVYVALDCTSVGGTTDGGTAQGTGSISVLDSKFSYVPYPITLLNGGPYPGIVLDNLEVDNSASVVLISGGATIVPGSLDPLYFSSWAMGNQYTNEDGTGGPATGFLTSPVKPASLLNGTGSIFTRSRPQYETLSVGDFVVVTDHGISNTGTGDQSAAINSLLASSTGTPVFFPAGIYLVESTVVVPVGSIIVGHGWSQIMGTGSFFANTNDPQVVVQVGNAGDTGDIEISDILFTVKGNTAGAVLMEWNVHESSPGSAGMWDSHFRVGGAAGTDLQLADCPANVNSTAMGGVNSSCIAASLLLHVTVEASAYFENVWGWVADHDLDNPLNALAYESGSEVPLGVQTQVDIYGGRGFLVESQGPVWFFGTAAEHSVLYQYQLYNAQNIFFGHMQTETPYFQAAPGASTGPFAPDLGSAFPGDPAFGDCEPNSICDKAWALRILQSTNVLVYSAGFYSFFNGWDEGCLASESCQSSLIETSYSQGLWLYNLFTIGTQQVVTPDGGLPPTLQSDNQAGFSTEVAVWLVLALQGADLGGSPGPQNGDGIVYIGNTIYVEPSPTVQCYPPCTLVFPPSTLPEPTTITLPPLTTTITVNTITTVTVLTPPVVTTPVISFWPLSIPDGDQTSTFVLTSSLQPPDVVVTISATTTTIVFPGYTGIGTESPFYVSGAASPTPTSSSSVIPVVFYSLPTTVVTSGTITQTFSEDQITTLSSLSSTTTLTTTWTESSSTTTTVVPVVVVVQTGGFYWSPIPLPGPTPFPIPLPDLPDLPPIPTLPCFRLFDIFSIDCPPDKSKPTTHFTSGAPSPTCTASCGTINESDSDENTSTASCETETNTACYTVTGATACQTYVGCACATSTVTDYWVSCAAASGGGGLALDGSGVACTTTSSAVVTGCYVTAAATTTGAAACPSGVSVDPSDDQGDDDGNPDPADATALTTVQTTLPEVVVIGGTGYTVTGSVAVVGGGETVTVPDVTDVSTTTLPDGAAATLWPGYTGPAIVANATVTVTDWYGGGSGSGGTTSVVPTSSTTTASPAPTPSVRIDYTLEQLDSGDDGLVLLWAVFVTAPPNATLVACDADTIYTQEADGVELDPGTIPYPNTDLGPFDLPAQYGLTGCTYTAGGESGLGGVGLGSMSCTSTSQTIICGDTTYSGDIDDCGGGSGIEYGPVCYWPF